MGANGTPGANVSRVNSSQGVNTSSIVAHRRATFLIQEQVILSHSRIRSSLHSGRSHSFLQPPDTSHNPFRSKHIDFLDASFPVRIEYSSQRVKYTEPNPSQKLLRIIPEGVRLLEESWVPAVGTALAYVCRRRRGRGARASGSDVASCATK